MVLLSALIDILRSKGILEDEDSSKIQDLASLVYILEDRLQPLLANDEKVYLKKINVLLKSKDFSKIKEVSPPQELCIFHDNLLSALHEYKIA